MVLREAGLRPLHSDPQLWVRTKDGILEIMVSTHLDDLKIDSVQRLVPPKYTQFATAWQLCERRRKVPPEFRSFWSRTDTITE